MPNIAAAVLFSQFNRASNDWPWIRAVEKQRGLPPYLLYAVGSRETNLRNILGDFDHGVGIWQRDDRSHVFPHGKQWYLNHPRQQAEDAATLLLANFSLLRDWKHAIAAYNAGVGGVKHALNNGRPADSATTGHDYSLDVDFRRNLLLAKFKK